MKHFIRVMCLTSTMMSMQAQAMPALGTVAPDFALASSSGRNLRLSELRGQVVLINFWATWCAPCRQEMPLLGNLYRQYHATGFALLGINLDGDRAKAQKMLAELHVEFPVLFDDKKKVAGLYNPDGMPTTILIDRDGRLRYIHRGYQSGFEKTYEQEIRELLKQ